MALAGGDKLGAYEILAPIGAGGMGEAYRAKDTKLKLDVALKVLPETFAFDLECMALQDFTSSMGPSIGCSSAIPPRANQQNLPDDVEFRGLGASSR